MCVLSVLSEGGNQPSPRRHPPLTWTPCHLDDPAPARSFLTRAPLLQVACEYGMVHVVSETGGPKGKDYCILYNSQWAHLPHDLSKAVSIGLAVLLAGWL